jgi:hypothetical protein
MYVYCADTYCDSCGLELIADLERQGVKPWPSADCPDSDHWPVSAIEEETDGPDHCAAYGECLEGIDLHGYGLADDAEMIGAEMPVIGALLSDGLTDAGVSYLRELLDDSPIHYTRGIGSGAIHVRTLTPYQEALHTYWREVFADYLD